ncbi:DUF2345 domain-containing protein [Collimonas silvisoli]|uniref:DUF2345 domain-containing protein n=1 Tax=Collimonas silvisoli TaxID=2825884 RepID=UPI001B8C88D0|nr:DUF2345 domain-containing protein [Collimonas silvisoli]
MLTSSRTLIANPELAAPHLLLAGATGIASSTPESTHIASGEHIALTSGRHLPMSVGKSLFASIAEKWSVFVQRLDLIMIAAKGKVTVRAESNAMELQAMKELHITSSDDSIYITAKKKIVVNGGGSFSEWSNGGITHGTVGAWIEHAASKSSPGPKSIDQAYPVMNIAEAKYAEKFSIFEPASGWSLPNQKYRIIFDGGRTVEGVSDAQGKTNIAASEVAQNTRIELLSGANNYVWSSFLWTVIKPQNPNA